MTNPETVRVAVGASPIDDAAGLPYVDAVSYLEEQVMPILSARSVTKTYRSGMLEVQALRGVDLDVEVGEFVIVMGPSGNGKTTLLNCLSGLDEIDEGKVEIEGLPLHELTDRKRTAHRRSEERRVGKECRSRWSP